MFPTLLLTLAGLIASGSPPQQESNSASPPPAIAERLDAERLARIVPQVARLTRWPDGSFKDDKSPLIVLLIGKGALAEVLPQALKGERVHSRPIEFKHCKTAEDLGEFGDFHLAIIGDLGTNVTKVVVGSLREKQALLISNRPGFAEMGGVLELRPRASSKLEEGGQREARFQIVINVQATLRHGLRMRSLLLKKAELYFEPEPEE